MVIIKGLLLLAILAALAVFLFIKAKGDCHLVFLVDQRTKFIPVEIKENYVTFSCQVPFINKGTQDGTLMDVHLRTLLPREYYAQVDVDGRLHNAADPRNDHYWEAVIIPYGSGGSVALNIKLTAVENDIRTALAAMVDMPMDIVYEVVGRRPIMIAKAYMVMTQEETRAAVPLIQAA